VIVVDVNIVAYFFIEGERTEDARTLWQTDPNWRLPVLWRHEFLNVLTSYVRHGGADTPDVLILWRQAVDLLSDGEMEIDWKAALELAVREDISAYDAQYIVLAQTLDTVCITQDKVLLKRFPEMAKSM